PGILAASDGRTRPRAYGVRSDRGRVLSMGSAYHAVNDPNNSFLGMVKVAESQRAQLADVADRLTRLDPVPDDVPALLGVGLVRSGVHLNQAFLGHLYWARPSTPEELDRAAEEIARVDEERVLL